MLTLTTAVIHIFLAFTGIPYYGLNFGVMLFILNGLGYLDKAIEVALIALLLAEARIASSEPSRIASGTRTTRP